MECIPVVMDELHLTGGIIACYTKPFRQHRPSSVCFVVDCNDNFFINPKSVKYLKGSCCRGPYYRIPINYFPFMAFLNYISSNLSDRLGR